MLDLLFGWVTPLVQRGYRQEQLNTQDLLPLPAVATPRACTSDLWIQWSKVAAETATTNEYEYTCRRQEQPVVAASALLSQLCWFCPAFAKP